MKRLSAWMLTGVLTVSSIAFGAGMAQAQETPGDTFVPALDTQAAVELYVIGGYDNFPSLETVAADFNEYYPSVEIIYEKVDDYENSAPERILSNQNIDLYMANHTQITTKKYFSDNALDLVEAGLDISALDEGVYEGCLNEDGKMLRLPIYCTTYGMLVNTDLLEENGLEIPKNYAEFADCCEKLSAAGYTPIYSYAGDNLPLALVRNMALVSAAKQAAEDDTFVERLNNGDETAIEAFRPAMEKLEQIMQQGWMDTEKNAEIEDSYNALILRFFEGDVPFALGTTTTRSGCEKRESESEAYLNNPFAYTFITAPIGEEGSYTYIDTDTGLAINKNSENVDYAAEFLRFYCTVKELNASADAKGLISPSSNSEGVEKFKDIDLSNEDYIAYRKDIALNSPSNKALTAALNAIAFDQKTVDEAMDIYYDTFASEMETLKAAE